MSNLIPNPATTTLAGTVKVGAGFTVAADGTITPTFGATAGLVAQGNDARIVGALPSNAGTATGLLLAADPATALGAATKQYVDAHTTSNYVRTNYSASGAISPADNMSLINASTTVTMTLGAGTVDNHLIAVNAYGAGSVVLTTSIRGTSQSVTLSGAAGALPQNLALHWLADLATYTVE